MDSFKKSILPSAILLIVGIILKDPGLIYIAGMIFGILYFYFEIKVSKSAINPIILYSLSMSLTSMANLVGIMSFGKANEHIYNLYADQSSLFDASLVHYFGLILFVLGFQLGFNKNWLPVISYKVRNKNQDIYLFVANLIVILLIIQGSVPGFLGAIQSFIVSLPLFTAFYMVKKGVEQKSSKYLINSAILVVLLTIHAVLFSYLRSDMIRPTVFFVLAYVISHKNIWVLLQWKLIPVYIFAIIFSSYFGIFGAERGRIGSGAERIETLIELKQTGSIEGETPIARATNFNQLSQVVRITREEGFLDGESLEYMTYVYIPRFIWTGKPLIQMGAWFAEKIGLGWRDYEGKYHNSINMTIPGELYLNFGYWGVIIGSLIIGFIIRLFWNAVRSWEDPNDLFANLLAAYLLFLGFFTLGADIQILVTVLATYLILLFLNRFVFRNA